MLKISRRAVHAGFFGLVAASALGAKARQRSWQRVFVGSITTDFFPANFGHHLRSDGIYTFLLDELSGEISPPSLAAKMLSPMALTIHPSKRFLYASQSQREGEREAPVVAFEIQGGGRLRRLNEVSSGGLGACQGVVDASGRFLLLCSFLTADVVAIRLNDDGSLGRMTAHVGRATPGLPNPYAFPLVFPSPKPECGTVGRTSGDNCITKPHAVSLSPGQKFALVPEINSDAVAVYRFDSTRGTLALHQMARGRPGSGPRHIAFGTTHNHAYTSDERGSSVSAWAWDEGSGSLKWLQALATAPEGYSAESSHGSRSNSPADIGIHPSGKYLWISNRGHPSLAGFAIDRATGLLSRIGFTSTGSLQCWSFAIDRSGSWLVAGLQSTDQVAIYKINANSGSLSDTGARARIGFPTSVKM